MRALTLALCLAVLGCKQSSVSVIADSAPVSASSEEELFTKWQAALESQVESDAKAGATRTFKSRDEARRFIVSLTPGGFRPRPEFFAALTQDAGNEEAFARRMSDFAQAHPDVVDKRVGPFMARLEPLMNDVFANVTKQFPSRWKPDVSAALADAKQRKLNSVILFCAASVNACEAVDRSFEDPAVDKLLEEKFVAARPDLDDPNSADAKKVKEAYKITALPVILVFDKSGHEIARQTSFVSGGDLLKLLSRAK